ncbi:hypothetical protein BDK88_2119 [Natrinema hispanicum]|uniref:TRAM domain-containing protein n=1 Tax=Natrinema hispanicum TaxID=392421 RepID=A0A482YGF3_9EURY|nr:hypothetical protein BDK88_2119 [Natrinema hispanicum]
MPLVGDQDPSAAIAGHATPTSLVQQHVFSELSRRGGVGRYQPRTHDSFIKCETPRCGANNAPEGSTAYDTACWRCGESLGGKPDPGDEVTVDIVDEQADGTLVCKTESGFVLFLEADTAAIEATVRVTAIDETHGEAELVDTES